MTTFVMRWLRSFDNWWRGYRFGPVRRGENYYRERAERGRADV